MSFDISLDWRSWTHKFFSFDYSWSTTKPVRDAEHPRGEPLPKITVQGEVEEAEE